MVQLTKKLVSSRWRQSETAPVKKPRRMAPVYVERNARALNSLLVKYQE